jgi:prolipoprotein diacylglyceryltransferase
VTAGATPSVITAGIDPTIDLGPVEIAWHGLTITDGIVLGGIVVAYDGRRRGLEPDRVYAIGMILVIAVRNSHPEALTPNPDLASSPARLYEVLLGALVLAIVWPLRKRLELRPLPLMWLMLALLALGRFFEFLLRSDSADLVLGLETAQWISLVLLGVATAGAWLTLRGPATPGRSSSRPATAKGRRA